MRWAAEFTNQIRTEYGRYPWSWRFVLQAWPAAALSGLVVSFFLVFGTLEILSGGDFNQSLHPFDLPPLLLALLLSYVAIVKSVVLIRLLVASVSVAYAACLFVVDLIGSLALAQVFYYLAAWMWAAIRTAIDQYGDLSLLTPPNLAGFLDYLQHAQLLPKFAEPFTVGFYLFPVLAVGVWGLALFSEASDGASPTDASPPGGSDQG